MHLKLLDLCCCGGMASLGYERAGFDVTGVDIESQPKYRGRFIQADAIEFLLDNHRNFDVFHASPPCQKWSSSTLQQRKNGKEYIDLIAPLRNIFLKLGKPYVIENVPNAPLVDPVLYCGAMFGLRTYRHRLFESNFKIVPPKHPMHIARNTPMGRRPKPGENIQYVGNFSGVAEVQEMLGVDWLGQKELAQSIPWHYTLHIGLQMRRLFDNSSYF